MRIFFIGLAFLLAWGASGALALSTDEVIRLKEAGVSDSLIQVMIENGAKAHDGSGVWEDDKYINYQAAPSQARRRDNQRHEQWKEERALDAADNVVIDGRRPWPKN